MFLSGLRNNASALAIAFVFAFVPVAVNAQTAGCDPSVSSAQSSQQLNYISGRAAMANQMFSQRPSTMSQMTCLQKLFSFGAQSMDILFQPPSMSSLLGLIQNFACQSMSQYFSQAGSGFTSMLGQSFGGLGGGGGTASTTGSQIIPGVSIGSVASGAINGLVMQGNGNFNTQSINPMSLFQGMIPQASTATSPGSSTTIGGLYPAWQQH